MVQEFHVLRCFSCETFQVHQVKKSNKWNCKLCGAKQSVRKEYGRGSGADCRRHVQKLNMLRATMDSAPPTCEDTDVSEQDPEWQPDAEDATDPQCSYPDHGQKSSKWEKFVAASDRTDDKDPSDPEDTQFTTDKNTFQQKKGKGKRQGERSNDRQGKRQRCEGVVPDVSARPSLVQTAWRQPTTEEESSPMFQEQRGYSNNASHDSWYKDENQGFLESNTKSQGTAQPAWQEIQSSSWYIQQLDTTKVTYKRQHQDFTEENTQPQTTGHPTWQHLQTTSITPSRVALPETLKTKVEESKEVKQLGEEESWNNKKKVDKRKPRLIGQGQGSLPSSSVSNSRWSKFTSQPADAEVDTDDDDETEHVENYGNNSTYRANDSSKLETSSTQYTGMEDCQIGQHSRGLQGVLGCHGDDPALQRCNQPIAKPACDPQDEVKTRMMDDTQNGGEVSVLRTAGFCTGEDLDDVLGEDVWDL
ncbi:uncharacterized protein LOC118426826 [Branchiostoma floridae]|uniref:Uncharacterized protein LOC118426826 n=1 Tax=Branchiostoma floridae TaxID=7739 RepID=A0A9J7LZR5_BRAFL|nr:uncharacterized protein LOC118426826 [Branchiostoma floridae]